MSASEDFEAKFVVHAASPSEIKATFNQLALKEEWYIGKYDTHFFYDVDNTGFYIGELNGIPISCISVVKYGDKYAIIGIYIVAEEYRGKGFGLKTFEIAMASSLMNSSDVTCGLYCEERLISMYKRSGFVASTQQIRLRETTPSIALQGLQSISVDVIIKPVSEVSFDKVSQYDSSVFGAPHDKYLKGLLSMPEQYGFVAINGKQDNIVGLVVVRKTIVENISLLGPLFANTPDIAKSLLKAIFEHLNAITPNEKIYSFEEIGFNPHCESVTSALSGILVVNYYGMYTKCPPVDMKKECVYVIASPVLG